MDKLEYKVVALHFSTKLAKQDYDRALDAMRKAKAHLDRREAELKIAEDAYGSYYCSECDEIVPLGEPCACRSHPYTY